MLNGFVVTVQNPAPAAPALGWTIVNLAHIYDVTDAAGITTLTMPGKTVTDTRTLEQWSRMLKAYRAEADVQNPALA